jgi:hypothetical protein
MGGLVKVNVQSALYRLPLNADKTFYLRRVRNNIVHPKKFQVEGREVQSSPENCRRAFVQLEILLQEKLGVQLSLNMSHSHIGVFER